MKREWGNLLLVLFFMASCAGCEKDTKKDSIPPSGTSEELFEEELQEHTHTAEEPLDSTADGEGDSIIDPPDEPAWVNYRIPQGGHYNSLRSFAQFPGDSLEFRFVFDATAAYKTRNPHNQADWNKLMGFSDCGSFHHNNSIRMVWRYTESDSIEIGEYWYSNGNRDFSSIGSVGIGDTVFARITAEDGFYSLSLNEKTRQVPRSCSSNMGRYWLYPYFGGNETAPQDINLHVQHLKPRLD